MDWGSEVLAAVAAASNPGAATSALLSAAARGGRPAAALALVRHAAAVGAGAAWAITSGSCSALAEAFLPPSSGEGGGTGGGRPSAELPGVGQLAAFGAVELLLRQEGQQLGRLSHDTRSRLAPWCAAGPLPGTEGALDLRPVALELSPTRAVAEALLLSGCSGSACGPLPAPVLRHALLLAGGEGWAGLGGACAGALARLQQEAPVEVQAVLAGGGTLAAARILLAPGDLGPLLAFLRRHVRCSGRAGQQESAPGPHAAALAAGEWRTLVAAGMHACGGHKASDASVAHAVELGHMAMAAAGGGAGMACWVAREVRAGAAGRWMLPVSLSASSCLCLLRAPEINKENMYNLYTVDVFSLRA